MPVLLSWNVAGRVRSAPDQAAVASGFGADVLALQEVRASALPTWREALASAGYAHVHAACLPDGGRGAPERRLGVLLAAREPLEPLGGPAVPWPERHACAMTTAFGEVHVLHAPISSKAERAKVRTLEAVTADLRRPRPHPVVLCGDLNTPSYETREGEVRSFARTRTGRLREGFDQRHDDAELGIVVGLRDAGYVDAFRLLHGYGRRDRSWVFPHGRGGWRLDHVLARGLEVLACEYEHRWREAGLSDHSAVWAELRSPPRDRS
ncbi:MAG TPA: endonuclease/exonuclease/phosphatase family protein [Baekduia sp.]|nr:endonuclease/exonuclease/phosphatase family protein [Baekduia sp.]